jgi:hypothetical protein
MQIELINVEIFEKMSQETTAFTADLYINNVKAGLARNDGIGGATYYQAYDPKGHDLIRKAESYCNLLPPMVFGPHRPGDQPITVPMSLDKHVDTLVSKFLFEKDMKHGIVFGKSYSQYSVMRFNHSIDNMLKNSDGVEIIKRVIEDVTSQLKEGQRILNTNLPPVLMAAANIQDQKVSFKNSPPTKIKASTSQQNKPPARKKRLK